MLYQLYHISNFSGHTGFNYCYKNLQQFICNPRKYASQVKWTLLLGNILSIWVDEYVTKIKETHNLFYCCSHRLFNNLTSLQVRHHGQDGHLSLHKWRAAWKEQLRELCGSPYLEGETPNVGIETCNWSSLTKRSNMNGQLLLFSSFLLNLSVIIDGWGSLRYLT